ncbi:MAG: TIR domain-containing protein [Ferruginibacter sp.]
MRNFSVDSTNHKDGRRPSNEVIERLLRMRVNWSSTIICLIGPETHKSSWVNYEIDQAHLQGKRIVGLYLHGSNNNVELPDSFKKYGGTPLGWNSLDKLGNAIEGKYLPAENPDGTVRAPIYSITRVKC